LFPSLLYTYDGKETVLTKKENNMETLICKKCNEEKTLKGFYKNTSGYHHHVCKPCFSNRQNTYYATNTPYNITNRLRTRCLQALKERGYTAKGLSYEDIFGCSRDVLIATIIDMSEEKGLTVDTMEIDHIIPLYFARNKTELLKLMRVSNLQVLSKEEHKVKTQKERELKGGAQ
jgi:hypothetical protein